MRKPMKQGREAFIYQLEKIGMAKTRAERYYDAMNNLHSAICQCDTTNLDLTSYVTLNGLLKMYISVNPEVNKLKRFFLVE